MIDLEKLVDFHAGGLFGAQILSSAAAMKAALAMGLIVYAIGFSILCLFAPASAPKSGADDSNPMLLIGP